MLPIQIFLLLFFVLAVVKVVSRYHSNQLNLQAAITWVIFWGAGAWIVVNPDSSFYFAKILGVGRGADAVIYLSLAGLFFLVFRLMVRIEKLNRDITILTREKALEKNENDL